jgi:hypothetical protein
MRESLSCVRRSVPEHGEEIVLCPGYVWTGSHRWKQETHRIYSEHIGAEDSLGPSFVIVFLLCQRTAASLLWVVGCRYILPTCPLSRRMARDVAMSSFPEMESSEDRPQSLFLRLPNPLEILDSRTLLYSSLHDRVTPICIQLQYIHLRPHPLCLPSRHPVIP